MAEKNNENVSVKLLNNIVTKAGSFLVVNADSHPWSDRAVLARRQYILFSRLSEGLKGQKNCSSLFMSPQVAYCYFIHNVESINFVVGNCTKPCCPVWLPSMAALFNNRGVLWMYISI